MITLFIDLFFTSITSPILYNTFAPVRRRRSLILPSRFFRDEDIENFLIYVMEVIEGDA